MTNKGYFFVTGGETPQTPLKKTDQFCELLSSEKLYKHCEMLSISNSEMFGPSCKFSICYTQNYFIIVSVFPNTVHFICGN